MAAACEISNVFSTYFSAMYSPEDPPGPPPTAPATPAFGADDPALGSSPPMPMAPPEGPEKASWWREQPQFWSKAQVLDWIGFQVEQHQADASAIDFSRCDMDGAALCRCAPEELRLVFGPLGDRLYAQLWELRASSFPDELSWILDLLEQDGASFQDPGPFDQGSPFGPETPPPEDGPQPSPFPAGGLGAGAPSPGSSDGSTAGSTAGTRASGCSHSSDSGGSDMDLDPRDSKLFSGADFPGHQKGDPKYGKRKRGRPRKLSRESREGAEGRKSKHAPRGTHLWEFIRDILLHPERNAGLLQWEDRRQGVFKFLRSEAVAQLWGQKKRNSSMTYEKLSRAMRYYYKREILERVDGRRLVYKFGRNSSGWKEEEEVEEEAGGRD